MENPNSWNDIQKAIDEVIHLYEINSNMIPRIYGLSLPTLIYNKLKSEGYLKEENINV